MIVGTGPNAPRGDKRAGSSVSSARFFPFSCTGMKRVLLGLLLLTAALPAAAQETRIAAVVNDEVISVADLAARMRLIFASSNIEDTPQAQERKRAS